MVTNRAVSILTTEYKVNLENLTAEELKIYVTRDLHDGEHYPYGKFGDASVFLDFYVGLCECDDAELANETFNENLNNIYWYDEENELKQAVDNELNKIKDDIEGEYVILFKGRDWNTSLEEQIREFIEYKKDDYEVMGYYFGEKIYRVKNKIYYLTDDSDTCNDEYYWKLQELGPKGYEHFKMK